MAAISQTLGAQTLTREQRLQMLDTYVTWAVMTGAPDCMERGLRHAEELRGELPDQPTIKGSFGSMLIEAGRLEEGEAVLRDAYETDTVAFDRGIIAAYIGRACFLRGDRTEADRWFELSRQADPEGIPLERFLREKEKGQTL